MQLYHAGNPANIVQNPTLPVNVELHDTQLDLDLLDPATPAGTPSRSTMRSRLTADEIRNADRHGRRPRQPSA